MKTLALALLFFSFSAVASPEAPTISEPPDIFADLENDIQVMDQMTPEQIESALGIYPGMDGDMIEVEDSNLWTTTNSVVSINVSLAKQSLSISYPGGGFTTRISSGRAGYSTKRGCFIRPRLARMHYSSKYNNAPMPHSMFFYGGYAIHGTTEEGRLGRPASHGCVRVSRANAATLFSIVKRFGAANTRICVR